MAAILENVAAILKNVAAILKNVAAILCANRFSCQTHNQVALGCFWVGLLLLGLALGL